MKTKSKQRYTHAIVYNGAPYGDGESGHVVSRHKSLDTAKKRWEKTIAGTMGVYNHYIAALDHAGDWTKN